MNDANSLTLIQQIATWALPVLFAIVFHEVAHGWVADKFGDKTARMMGRLTLNPAKHIDLVGTILLPGLLLLTHAGFIFGWAKPVPVNARNLRHPKRDMAIVAAAGPLSNLLMAFAWAGIAKLVLMGFQTHDTSLMSNIATPLFLMGQHGIMINVFLMVLNLIPIPPLDGSKVVSNLLPGKIAYRYDRLERLGFIILLVLMFTGLLSSIIIPPSAALIQMIGSVVGLS